MELRSLLLSQDKEMIEVVQRALLDLGIGVEVYSTADWAGEDLSDSKFDAIILDCEVSGASGLLKSVRKTASNGRALTFAIVTGDEGLHSAFEMGANLALQKPISLDRARSSLRAAYGLIMQERRRYFRLPVDIVVRVSANERTQVVATAMNVSEGGMALKSQDELQLNGLVKLTFLLPGEKSDFEIRAVVVWKDARGHNGVRFEQMTAATRQKLGDWIAEQATFF